EALRHGLCNLDAHVKNMRKYGVPVVVAINRFATDTDAEIKVIADFCESIKVEYALAEVFARGGEGAKELAKKVVEACDKPSEFRLLYKAELPVKEKVKIIAEEIYGADGVTYTQQAEKKLKEIEALGKSELPICVAKTQYSLSDNPAKLGRPCGFNITVKDIKLSAGAGFIVVYCGDIMTMPGLPKTPAANLIDVTADGHITGLF
ncbi:MAG: formate--tetrahydrofolate ligase, partial [Hydrogenoanaerobacterium sp.]